MLVKTKRLVRKDIRTGTAPKHYPAKRKKPHTAGYRSMEVLPFQRFFFFFSINFNSFLFPRQVNAPLIWDFAIGQMIWSVSINVHGG